MVRGDMSKQQQGTVAQAERLSGTKAAGMQNRRAGKAREGIVS